MHLYYTPQGAGNTTLKEISKIKKIKEEPFRLEGDIQTLFENNLLEIMELIVVKREFTIEDKRIDTLAYNEQTKAFTIIEFKRAKNISVIDQGFTYLSLMLKNKAEFIVEYNEQLKKNLQRKDIDWEQTRVAFVSQSFTDQQIQALDFKDLPIELWKVTQYESGIIAITTIAKSKTAPSIKKIIQEKEETKAIANEIKVYTEEDHLANISEEIVELYEKFKAAIVTLIDGVEIKPQKHYISFKKGGNVVDIAIRKSSLVLWINSKKDTINDFKGISRNVAGLGHQGNGDYEINIKDDRELEYIMSLIKQHLIAKNLI